MLRQRNEADEKPLYPASMIDPSLSITPGMTVKTLLEKYPRAVLVFLRMGMHCPGCQAAAFHSLKEAARQHNCELKILIDKLNRELYATKKT